MKFLIFGDLQIGKSHHSYKVNPFANITYGKKEWWSYTKFHIYESIKNAKQFIDDELYVVFLGDILDMPMLSPEEVYEFKDIIDFCIIELSPITIDIVLGNHETTEVYSKPSSLISLLDGYKNVVNVYYKNFVKVLSNGYKIVYLPYQKPELFLESLDDILPFLEHDNDNVIIFTHNDIASKQIIKDMLLIPVNDIYDKIGFMPKFVFNGHIHRSYLDGLKNFLQVGSVSPCTFDDDSMQNYGIVLYDPLKIDKERLLSFPNYHVLFLKVESDEDIHRVGSKIDTICHELDKSYIAIRYSEEYEDHINDLCKTYPSNILYILKYVVSSKIVNSDNSDGEKVVKPLVCSENGGIVKVFSDYIRDKYNFELDDIKLNE